jgi:hypothetical protein
MSELPQDYELIISMPRCHSISSLLCEREFCRDSDSDDNDDDGKVRHVSRVQFDGHIEVELSGETLRRVDF